VEKGAAMVALSWSLWPAMWTRKSSTSASDIGFRKYDRSISVVRSLMSGIS